MGAVAALNRGARGRRRGLAALLALGAVVLAGCASKPPAEPPAGDAGPAADIAELRLRDLSIPVEGVRAAQLRDSFTARRGPRLHLAIDIMAPRGTPVRAVEDGRVLRMNANRAGGITLYQADPSGRYIYYYAHLDRYAPGLAVGQTLARGDPIGTVGSSGNAPASAPHLHFAIYRVDPGGWRWPGTPVNPYAVWRAGDDPR
ncbi:MAG: M23 family metallopeptidase [Burkholderiaceae bacterium]|nr:M23 family metallopeptidase [Burkholderiaceae bacterium]